MGKTFHILNGDALKTQFPSGIEGELFVLRECLVDGPVSGTNYEELYRTRARFLSQSYGVSSEDYYAKSVDEFAKIEAIPEDTEICLWFEDDLFCQVNFWFAIDLIKGKEAKLFLVRPRVHTSDGFAGLDSNQLKVLYETRQPITEIDILCSFWALYQCTDTDGLFESAARLQYQYPFLLPAVQALADSLSVEEQCGRPLQTLIQIKKDLKTEEFEPIFKEFSKREPIYGFGDLQIKRLLSMLE